MKEKTLEILNKLKNYGYKCFLKKGSDDCIIDAIILTKKNNSFIIRYNFFHHEYYEIIFVLKKEESLYTRSYICDSIDIKKCKDMEEEVLSLCKIHNLELLNPSDSLKDYDSYHYMEYEEI